MTDSTEPAGYGHAETLAPLAREAIATMTPVDYLAALGATADGIAATLTRLGVTGVQVVADACPIARYLREHTLTGWVAVSANSIALDDADLIITPRPVAEFIRAFDRGAYPELVAPGGYWDATL